MGRKKWILIASFALVVALAAAGITTSYYTSQQTVVNHFDVAELTPQINENSKPALNSVNSIPETAAGVFPKVIQVKNKKTDRAINSYVRVQLIPSLRDGNSGMIGDFKMTDPKVGKLKDGGASVPSISFVPFGNADRLRIVLVFDDNWNNKDSTVGYWNYREDDNCFYYTKHLAPGEKTEQPLLKEIRFYGAESQKWQSRFRLDVLTDSIQAEGKTAKGKSAPEEAWRVKIYSNGTLVPVSPD